MFFKWASPSTSAVINLTVNFKSKNYVIILPVRTVRDGLATSRACTVVLFQTRDAFFAVISFTAVGYIRLTRYMLTYVAFQRFKDKRAVKPISV